MVVKKEIQIGNKTLSFETGRFARQADGAVITIPIQWYSRRWLHRKNPRMIWIIFHFKWNTAKTCFAGGNSLRDFLKREGRPSDKRPFFRETSAGSADR